MFRASTLATLTTGLLVLTGQVAAAAPETNQAGPAEVVRSFNAAVTDRNLEQLLGHFAEGGVQFNLRPSHGGLQTGPMTTELTARWSMVGPVLFSATSVYERHAKILDVHATGDVATVWAEVSTRTTMASSGETSSEAFTEVYLLVHRQEGWRIAAVADNRQPDNIGIAAD